MTLALIGAGIRDDYMARDYGNTFDIAANYLAFQVNDKRSTYYLPSYKNTDYIWSADVSNDPTFKNYYISNKNVPIAAVSYNDWTKALTKVDKKTYKAPYFRILAFDQQLKGVIQKDSK